MTEEVSADKLAKIYVKIRERRLELEKQVDALKEQQDLVASQMLELCKAQGATSIKTEHGTISKRTNKRYWTGDWESFCNFVKDHDAFALLQQRINNANMEQFLQENPDLHPPGLNADVTQTVVIVKR